MHRRVEDSQTRLKKALFESISDEVSIQDAQAEMAGNATLEGLRRASGISDEAVLASLAQQGLASDTVAALTLVPLIRMAWIDGKVQEPERALLLSVAHRKGISSGSNAYKLLDHWLRESPSPDLFDAWKLYVSALAAEVLTERQLDALRSQIVGFAREMAESAGGFLGLRKTSDKEKQFLAEIEAAFRYPHSAAP